MSADTRYPMDCRLPIADCRLNSNRKSKIANRKSAIPRGFLLIELIVALTVLGLLLGGLGVSLAGFARFNRYQLTRQQCIAAAQAQLESIAATGEPIPDQDFTRLWPKLTVSIQETPGEGQWQALTLIEVTASDQSRRKSVDIQLSRYIGSQTSEDRRQKPEDRGRKTEDEPPTSDFRLLSSDLRLLDEGN